MLTGEAVYVARVEVAFAIKSGQADVPVTTAAVCIVASQAEFGYVDFHEWPIGVGSSSFIAGMSTDLQSP
jgi:hypothetical protein